MQIRVFASGGQEAFFEGHVHALKRLGGVPTGKVRYDNLRSAVAKVLGFSRQRIETQRWTAFRSHYGLDVFYCQPGIDNQHRLAEMNRTVEKNLLAIISGLTGGCCNGGSSCACTTTGAPDAS